MVLFTGGASNGASVPPANSGANTVSGSWVRLVLVTLDVVGICDSQSEAI